MTVALDTTDLPMPAEEDAAEAHLLGSAMATPSGLDAVLQLTTDHFKPGRHQDVFRTIIELHNDGAVPTPDAVRETLERDGRRTAGPFIFELYQAAVPVGGEEYYVHKVVEASKSRRLLQASQQLAQLAKMDPSDTRTETALSALADLSGVLSESTTTDHAQRIFEREVKAEARKLRAREEAHRIVRRERLDQGERPRIKIGTDFLAEPDPLTTYRIDRLWPSGGRILLVAQFKAGKSTTIANLIRSLVDAEPFLGRFTVTRQARRVVLIDNEIDEDMLRRWLRDQGIQRDDLFATLSLRGRLSTFDILDPEVRAEWAADLRAVDADVVIFDCLRPVLDALGLDENRETGRFLTAFDELLGEAGVKDGVVVHHMGHQGERSRGDSRLRDWPDVEWRLVREEEDPASPRYFSAYGRDVDVPESALTFEATTRHLTIADGNRKEAKGRQTLPAVLDVIGAHPDGVSGRKIEEALTEAGESRQDIRQALKLAIRDQMVITFAGPRRATLHVLRTQ